MIDFEGSGSHMVPEARHARHEPTQHPTLDRALSNPIVKLIMYGLFGVLLTISTTMIASIDTRLDLLEEWRIEQRVRAEHRVEDLERWQRNLDAHRESNKELIGLAQADLALKERILEALDALLAKGSP